MRDTHSLPILAAVLMGFDAIAPIVIPEWITLPVWRFVAVVVFLLAVVCLWRQGVLLSREEKEDRRQKQETDRRFEQLAELLKEKQTLAPRTTSPVAETLRDKVLQLGHDLFAFLREKGPRPSPRIEGVQPWEEKFRAIVAARGPYVEAIHYGYLHRFRQPVIDLFNELAEHGIRDPEIQQWEIDPPQVATESTIRKIAEHLFLLAAKIDMGQASKGT